VFSAVQHSPQQSNNSTRSAESFPHATASSPVIVPSSCTVPYRFPHISNATHYQQLIRKFSLCPTFYNTTIILHSLQCYLKDLKTSSSTHRRSLSSSTLLHHYHYSSPHLPHLASVTSQLLLDNALHNPSATSSYVLSALPQRLQPSNHPSSPLINYSTTLHLQPIYTTTLVSPLPLLTIAEQQPASSLSSPLLHHHYHVHLSQRHVHIYIITTAKQ
jgi:hypothetical protein